MDHIFDVAPALFLAGRVPQVRFATWVLGFPFRLTSSYLSSPHPSHVFRLACGDSSFCHQSPDKFKHRLAGSVSDCQDKGGTWIELGQLGNWNANSNLDLGHLTQTISDGEVSAVTAIGLNGAVYGTGYNPSGNVSWTDYGGWVNVYSYSLMSPNGTLTGGFADPNSSWINWVRTLQQIFGTSIPVNIDPADSPTLALRLALEKTNVQSLNNACTIASWYTAAISFNVKVPEIAMLNMAHATAGYYGYDESTKDFINRSVQSTCTRLGQ